MSEEAGRGAAWTEERGTSDEGRRCLTAPRRIAPGALSDEAGLRAARRIAADTMSRS